MGFNKRYISKDSLRKIVNGGDYLNFLEYFKSDALLFDDAFSFNIMKDLSNYDINDKEEILKIMDKCR